MHSTRIASLAVLLKLYLLSGIVHGVQPGGMQHAAECGVYSLIAAASSLGVNVDVNTTLAGTRRSTFSGSTSFDLCESARAMGLWVAPIKGVTVESLRYSTCPLLLLLKTELRSDCAGHWVAYLGEDKGQAVVFDVLESTRVSSVDYGELSLLMSGDAILMALKPPSIEQEIWWRIASLEWMWSLLVVALVVSIPKIRLATSKWRLSVQVSILLAMSVCFTFVNGEFSTVNPWSEPASVAWVQSKHMGSSFPEVQYEQLVSLQNHQRATIVDARLAEQFAFAHIPGAINLPVNSRPSDLAEQTKAIPRNEWIIVYCAARDCDWDLTVARRLKALGFANVRIFEDGLATYARRAWQMTPQ